MSSSPAPEGQRDFLRLISGTPRFELLQEEYGTYLDTLKARTDKKSRVEAGTLDICLSRVTRYVNAETLQTSSYYNVDMGKPHTMEYIAHSTKELTYKVKGYVDMCTFAAKPSTPSKRSQPSSTGTPSRTFHVHEEGMKAGLPSSALLGSQRWVAKNFSRPGSKSGECLVRKLDDLSQKYFDARREEGACQPDLYKKYREDCARQQPEQMHVFHMFTEFWADFYPVLEGESSEVFRNQLEWLKAELQAATAQGQHPYQLEGAVAITGSVAVVEPGSNHASGPPPAFGGATSQLTASSSYNAPILQGSIHQNPRNSLSSAICDDEQLPTYSAEATDFAAVQHITRLAAELKQLEHFDVQNLSKLPNQLFKFQEQLLDFQATSGRLLAKSRLSIGADDQSESAYSGRAACSPLGVLLPAFRGQPYPAVPSSTEPAAQQLGTKRQRTTGHDAVELSSSLGDNDTIDLFNLPSLSSPPRFLSEVPAGPSEHTSLQSVLDPPDWPVGGANLKAGPSSMPGLGAAADEAAPCSSTFNEQV